MSINNTPTIGPYTKLEPFRFWCQKVIPLVYDESLSYYELLCKLVDYLNKTMADVDLMASDMEEFRAAYAELIDYVNNYFADLDITEEINNKLDQMAEDGTLTSVIRPIFADAVAEIPGLVSDWLNDNITQETGYVIDKSLLTPDAAADALITGNIRRVTEGLFGALEYLFYDDDIPLTFQRGFRGATSGASVAVQDSINWSCSDLIAAVPGDIFTLYNLMPDKFRFVIRAYTENEANNGVYTSDSILLLNDDLSQTSYTINGTYSNVNNGVYKNEIAIFKTTSPNIKYWSVHIRPIGNEQISDEDILTLSHGIKLVQRQAFLPYFKRSRVGDYGFIFGPNYGRINIDTTAKTATITGTCTFKSGKLRINNPTWDLSGLDPDAHQTYYFDCSDNTIKVTGYATYQTLAGIENTIYLGSAWPAGTVGPNPWIDLNTNLTITINNEIQKIAQNPVRFLKVLVTGDSICRGGRNGGKGFIGDVNRNFVNLGIGGATLSNVNDSSSSTDTAHAIGAANIPDTIVKYAAQTAQSWYMEPDAIIASGGINDLIDGATLGSIPTRPINSDAEAALLDPSLVTDSLSLLFYQMIKNFPNAHRFFLITHRNYNRPWTAGTGGWNQTQFHDAAVAICKLYGVTVIDVFNEGMLDSYFDQYVSPTPYSQDQTVTNLYYIDNDRVHPLALGYERGYEPLVESALHKALIE